MKRTINKRYLALAQNASGRQLNVPIYTLSDNIPGPKVYIQSSIHGSEVQGNVVIYQLMEALQQQTIYGSITLVPNCNPVGTNIKAGEYTLGRFDPINGTNWNRGYFYDKERVLEFGASILAEESIESIKSRFRVFWREAIEQKLNAPWGLALAQQLNLALQVLAFDADIVLDLHTGPVATRHIYIPENARQAAQQFSIPFCIFIPNQFAGALDEASFCPWWTLEEFIEAEFERRTSFGIEAFTIELGSQEVLSFDEGEKDARSILGYLAAKGVINAAQLAPKTMIRRGVDLKNYKTLYTDFGGLVDYQAKLGKPVEKGQLMAKVLNVDELDTSEAHYALRAPCDLIPILRFPSASVLSGTQLFKCFTQYYELG
jgi:predicted deacylase